MKHIPKNPVFYFNTLLLAFLALLILNANAERLHLPHPIRQALAAVAITGDGSTDKLAAFAAVNQIGDSIVEQVDSSTARVNGSLKVTQTFGVTGDSLFQGNIAVVGNSTAKAFFDKDDNSYVADPNTNSRFNALRVTGNLQVDGHIWAHTSMHVDSGDYAEWFEKEGDARPGDVIGINTQTGKARTYRQGDHFLGIYSANPAIIANTKGIDDKEMARTHALVGLLGQLDFNTSQTITEGRIVKTLDGAYVGVLLSSGKVLVGR